MRSYRRTFGGQIGKAAVETRLTAIALLMRTTFPSYAWESETAGDPPEFNRLHIRTPQGEAQLDFTERELVSYSLERYRTAIDHRMYDALTGLLEPKH